jgi:methylthioribose-1-phosphate isomerase
MNDDEVPRLNWSDLATLMARADSAVVGADTLLEEADVHQRFDGRYTVTLEATHYGVAFQLATALDLNRERDVEPCQTSWSRVQSVNGKHAVLRVVFIDTKRGRDSAWDETKEAAA